MLRLIRPNRFWKYSFFLLFSFLITGVLFVFFPSRLLYIVNSLWIIWFIMLGFFATRWLLTEGYRPEGIFMFAFSVCYLVVGVISVFVDMLTIAVVWAFTFVYLLAIGDFLDVLVEKVSSNRPKSVNILGVRIDNETKKSALDKIDGLIRKKGVHLVVTPYSEYVVNAQGDDEFRKALNSADLSLADGIFILWSTSFLRLPVSRYMPLRVIQSIFLFFFTALCTLIYPGLTSMVIVDRVPGSEFVFPLCEMAAEKGYSVFLLGGFDFGRGNSGILAAEKLKQRYPELRVAGVYPGNSKKENIDEAVQRINKASPDILLMCYKKGKVIDTESETWVYQNSSRLNTKVAIGLGGTFDYVAGYAKSAPRAVKRLGLEWFWRQFSSRGKGLTGLVRRIYRVWRGITLSSIMVLLYKIKRGYSWQ